MIQLNKHSIILALAIIIALVVYFAFVYSPQAEENYRYEPGGIITGYAVP